METFAYPANTLSAWADLGGGVQGVEIPPKWSVTVQNAVLLIYYIAKRLVVVVFGSVPVVKQVSKLAVVHSEV